MKKRFKKHYYIDNSIMEHTEFWDQILSQTLSEDELFESRMVCFLLLKSLHMVGLKYLGSQFSISPIPPVIRLRSTHKTVVTTNLKKITQFLTHSWVLRFILFNQGMYLTIQYLKTLAIKPKTRFLYIVVLKRTMLKNIPKLLLALKLVGI